MFKSEFFFVSKSIRYFYVAALELSHRFIHIVTGNNKAIRFRKVIKTT